MIILGIISDERAFRSKSPAMHSAVLANHDLAGIYLPFQVESDQIEQAIQGLKALGLTGANVTVPYKQSVMAHLDELSEESKAIGAVNTILNRQGRLSGHNTDAAGFIAAIENNGIEIKDSSALVVGNGGAARAVIYALMTTGVQRLILAGRDLAWANHLAKEFGVESTSIDSLSLQSIRTDLIINTTSVSSPIESVELARATDSWNIESLQLVFDLNYGRSTNMWSDLAKANGANFIDGLPMLAHQARLSFKLWTGIDANIDEFMDTLK